MAASIAAACAISELIKLKKKPSFVDGRIMRHGDTMGRDGESLALELWRGSADGSAYSAKAQAACLLQNAISVLPAFIIGPLIQFCHHVPSRFYYPATWHSK